MFPTFHWLFHPTPLPMQRRRLRSASLRLEGDCLVNPYSACSRHTQQRPLAQFYGAGHHGTCKDLRKALSQNYKCTSSAHLSKGLPFMYGYHKATFCPCPGGDSPSAKRNFDALHAGCIPVTLSSDFVWPFTQEVGMSKNPLEFSIRLDAPNYQTALFDHNCVALSAINASNNLQSYFETIRIVTYLLHRRNLHLKALP